MRKITRILLVYPPTTIYRDVERKRIGMPLGLAYLAAFLEQDGFEVRIVDASVEAPDHEVDLDETSFRFGLSYEAIQEIIVSYAQDIVGVSILYSSQAENGYTVCERAKAVNEHIITVVGGAHPTSQPKDVLTNPAIDFVVIGEGEIPMKLLLQYLQGTIPSAELDGVGCHTEQGISIYPKKQFVEDLDALPFPAWHLLSFNKYFEAGCAHGTFQHSPYAPVFTSRGCPYHCTFCFAHRVHGRRFRKRSVSNILAEIETLMKDYGVKEIHFEDDSLTTDRKRAVELFTAFINRDLRLSWTTPNGVSVSTLDKNLLRLMRDSGCYKLILAVESGSQRVLSEIMHKPLQLEKVIETMKNLAELEIPVALYWMLGLPGETKQDIEASIELAIKLRTIHPMGYSSFSIFTPFKGTKLYDVCLENGYFTHELAQHKLKYCFSQISTPDFSSEYIEKMRKIAWQRANDIGGDDNLDNSPHLAFWIPDNS